MNGTIAVGWPLAVVLTLFAVAAALTAWLGGIASWRPFLTASGRAAIQLAVVSALIVVVLGSGWLTAGFVLLMYSIAALTSGRRIFGRFSMVPAASIAIGVAPVLVVLFGSRVVPLQPIAVIPIAGILIGGAMTVTSLAGRRAVDELATRRGEYEAARALGFPVRDAALLVLRPSAHQALVPALDQTRTVGLVTLPGAFIGVLLGGGDPIQAGAAQAVVLAAHLAIEAVAVLVTIELLARQASVVQTLSRRLV